MDSQAMNYTVTLRQGRKFAIIERAFELLIRAGGILY